MKPERWARIKPIFSQAAELGTEERSLFIKAQCDGDESLALEIESLLVAHDQAGPFIEGTPGDFAATALEVDATKALIGRRIGAYEVIRELGEGGMGAVYLATRADEQYRKLVAIKLIKRGFDHESIIRRFRNERQIMASLDHPNIGRLLDGGVTPEGSPYFVMEYIDGTCITEYCDLHRLGTVDRLRLFRSVCSAVHYAHQNLIVHRDIKPGNVLVTADGTVKLLDFGIAKLLGPSTEVDELTLGTMPAMTPGYASPEQVRGESITTSSDVYSLGVLLYELLTGHRPYRLAASSPLEMVQAICEQEPRKPSTAVVGNEPTNESGGDTNLDPESVSKARNSQPEKLRRQLEGDLDNIVLKAMRKEPPRRYVSVEQFSEDIRRHLEGLPVIARRDTLSYRAGKFIRRNKLGVAAAALIMVLLAAGVVGIARQTVIANRQRARAEKRFNDVRNLANSFMFKFHDSIAKLPGSTEARQLVVSESLAYLNSLADESSDDLALQSELAMAYFRLGEIQAHSRSGNLQDLQGAFESHRKALALREQVAAARRDDRQAQLYLAASYERVGSHATDEEAIASLHKAIGIYEAIRNTDPTDLAARKGVASSYHGLGQLLATSEPKAALQAYERAMSEREAYLKADPSDRIMRRDLSLLYKNIGAQIIGADGTGDMDKALTYYKQALTIDEADSAADSNDPEVRMALSLSYGSIGGVLAAKGELSDALNNYRKALDIRLSLASTDSKNAFARERASSAYLRIANILERMGDYTGALYNYKEMLTLSQSLQNVRQQAADCSTIADFYSRRGSAAPAIRERIANMRDAVYWYRKSLELGSRIEGNISDGVAKERQRIAQEIARCDAIIASRKSN